MKCLPLSVVQLPIIEPLLTRSMTICVRKIAAVISVADVNFPTEVTEIDRQAVGSGCQSEVLRRHAGEKDATGDPVAHAACGRIRQREILGSQATGQAKAMGIASEGEVRQPCVIGNSLNSPPPNCEGNPGKAGTAKPPRRPAATRKRTRNGK